MSPTHIVTFQFPPVTQEQLKRDRLRAFYSSLGVALCPYLGSVVWHFLDDQQWSVLFVGIPDLALAAVVIAIAAYSNSILSFVKLDGWRGIGKWTFIAAVIVAGLAFLSLVQYFKFSYAPPATHNKALLFYSALVSMVGTALFSFLLQVSFVSDECRSARHARLILR
jgi:hypothetical protein